MLEISLIGAKFGLGPGNLFTSQSQKCLYFMLLSLKGVDACKKGDLGGLHFVVAGENTLFTLAKGPFLFNICAHRRTGQGSGEGGREGGFSPLP